MNYTLTALTCYPVKSLAGIQLTSTILKLTGLQYDRCWMVVAPDGRFMSQRQHPRMAQIQTYIGPASLRLSLAGYDDCVIQLSPPTASVQTRLVQVWEASLQAYCTDPAADAWLSEALRTPCHLVRFPDNTRRQVDLNYARTGDQTAFSDGFPILLISEASLTALNRQLDTPVEMRRFRPNIVVSGCDAFAEDHWKRIRIGAIKMRVVKPCSRCAVTTVEPETGNRTDNQEPLKTLSKFRKQGNKVLFGQNVLHDQTGTLRLGDSVEILEA